MGWLSWGMRAVAKELKPYTRDDRRRDFQKRQWRRRVDARMAEARNPGAQPGYWMCTRGHRHRVYARALECNEKAARALNRGSAGGHSLDLPVGAQVVDPTGKHGQIEQVLGPNSVVVRWQDGTTTQGGPSWP
jgi:hypothetical protein